MGCEDGPLGDGIVEQALRSVEDDVRRGFDGALSAGKFVRDLNGADLGENDVVATSDHLVVVPWVYVCTHVGEFLGVPPTFVEFELRGTTFVHACGADPGEWEYYRYIDYVGALHQLGSTTTSRPSLTPEEYLNWNEHRNDPPGGVLS